MEPPILNGWKEIGAFLQRGTRTAQRWELLFGMPVHRPANRPRTAVVAFPEELRLWLMSNRAALDRDEIGSASLASLHLAVDRLETQSREISVRLSMLKQRLKTRAETTGGQPRG